jgi:hypothetical protein
MIQNQQCTNTSIILDEVAKKTIWINKKIKIENSAKTCSDPTTAQDKNELIHL